jgi:hypothetical protein
LIRVRNGLVVEIEYVEKTGLKLDTLYRYMNCKLQKMDKRKILLSVLFQTEQTDAYA